MSKKNWDAIVIGGGPAGASAARTLIAGGMKCLIIEKKKMPREKMCSGILSNWTVDFVHRKFGAIPAETYCEPNFLDGVALHFPSIENPVTVDSHSAIPNVWRSHFDRFLAEKSKAEILDGHTMRNVEVQTRGFKVECKVSMGKKVVKESFTSKYLIGADGINPRTVRLITPETHEGLPLGIGMQMHYNGSINLDPKRFHVFFYPNVGFYAWASFKDEDIHVGCGIIGVRGQKERLENFIELLKEKYDLKIKRTVRTEGMVGAIKAPLNVFTLGKGNFLAAGDAGGFMHNFGEGISCALTTGDLAAKAILTAEESGKEASDIYREIVRGEAELCLDQFNPLRMFKAVPMPMDFASFRQSYSKRNKLAMWRELRAFGKENINGSGGFGLGKVIKRNMRYRLFHDGYSINL